MFKIFKNSGFVAMPIIIGSAVLVVGILGGLAYEFKNNQSVLSVLDKNKLLAQVSGVIKCGVNTFRVENSCTETSNSYRNAYFKCYDGVESYQGGPTSCKTSEDWQQIGGAFCSGHCASTAPIITVISPNGGETFYVGDVVQIKWNLENAQSFSSLNLVRIGLYNELMKKVIVDLAPNNGFSSWSVPKDFEPGDYKITVVTIDGIQDSSDNYFTISGSTTCIGENIETSDMGKSCCPGLIKKDAPYSCPPEMACPTVMSIICVKPESAVCDPAPKAIVDSMGGCSKIDKVAYSNLYNKCCFTICDTTSKAIVDSVGGCSAIDQIKYSNVYQACCTKVTKEKLLYMLNDYLADGVISDIEKTNLLTALNSYLQ